MFAYCENNPVICVDYSGQAAHVIVGAIVDGVISLGMSWVSNFTEEDDGWTWHDTVQVLSSTLIGAGEGAAIAAVPNVAVPISAFASAAESAINDFIDNKSYQEILTNSMISGFIGAASSAAGSAFAEGKKIINEGFDSIGNAIKKGVHPAVKKKARKALKKAAKYIKNSAFYETVETIIYEGISEATSWYTNNVIERFSR